MIRCPSCGQENVEGSRFCNNCGSSLSAAAVPSVGEVRKTVSVLFADVVSSTARGEQTDPESTRRRLSRYFSEIRLVVERHGGTVEKFIGDAVMAVFGIPTLHEDDAVRAVRAARDIGLAVEALNADLADTSWAAIELRIGVNTGEVVAGDPTSGQTLVTGDAVNVAARLEQAANPGEVLMGAATHNLVRGVIDVEPRGLLELKGKAAPVEAYRLVGLKESDTGGRHDTPLVDRVPELKLLADSFQRAVDERACYLFTLLGSAGVGKSRLIHEFLNQIRERARVLRARCLPYGQGITFWPIVELTQVAAEIVSGDSQSVARQKLETLLADSPERDDIVERVAAAIGLSTEAVPTEEIFWGVRKLLELLAAVRPLVVVIDDLHWAEPTLLDLIEHLADWSREAPILLLAVARPELLDARPQWGGGKFNATTMLLEPLTPDDSTQLIDNLIHDWEMARALQLRIGGTAEGNPLFVEELVAMLVDEGVLERRDGGWEVVGDLRAVHVPPTVAALVAARLDHLEPSERDVIGRASVVGKVFQRSAVTELSPPERRGDLKARLMGLVRKELLRPDRSPVAGDDVFRFRHILVRDAAYAALPKEQRTDLHARFADWLERTAGERLPEYEEIIGYHFEQAYALRTELGFTDELTSRLGERAADHLRTAGIRAWARHDASAAESLMSRAADLSTDARERGRLWLRLSDVVFTQGDLSRARQLLADASDAADEAGDELLGTRAQMLSEELGILADPGADESVVLTLSERTEALAVARGDLRARVEALQARAFVWQYRCRWADMLGALEEALSLLPGDDLESQVLRSEVHDWIGGALRYGPVPASEGASRIDKMVSESAGGVLANFLNNPPLLAMQGDIDEARARIRAGITYFKERGLRRGLSGLSLPTGAVETLAGDLEAAQRAYADGIAILQSMGDTAVLSTLSALRATILYRLGRIEEMEEAIRLARKTGSPADIATQAAWRVAAAEQAADNGRHEEAQRLIGEAGALVEPTDFLELRGQVFEAQAHVAARAGRLEEWQAALGRALAEHERKGNVVDAKRIRDIASKKPPASVT